MTRLWWIVLLLSILFETTAYAEHGGVYAKKSRPIAPPASSPLFGHSPQESNRAKLILENPNAPTILKAYVVAALLVPTSKENLPRFFHALPTSLKPWFACALGPHCPDPVFRRAVGFFRTWLPFFLTTPEPVASPALPNTEVLPIARSKKEPTRSHATPPEPSPQDRALVVIKNKCARCHEPQDLLDTPEDVHERVFDIGDMPPKGTRLTPSEKNALLDWIRR